MKLMGLFFTMLCLVGGSLRAMDSCSDGSAGARGMSDVKIPTTPRARTYAKAQYFNAQDQKSQLEIAHRNSVSQRKLPVKERVLLKHGGHENAPLDLRISEIGQTLQKCEENLQTYAFLIRRGQVAKNKARVDALSYRRDICIEALANCEKCVTAESDKQVLCDDCALLSQGLEEILHEIELCHMPFADRRKQEAARLQEILARCASCGEAEGPDNDACEAHKKIAEMLFAVIGELTQCDFGHDCDDELVVAGDGLAMKKE
jgi:hypothetical protein